MQTAFPNQFLAAKERAAICNLRSCRKEASEIAFITMFAAAPDREYGQVDGQHKKKKQARWDMHKG